MFQNTQELITINVEQIMKILKVKPVLKSALLLMIAVCGLSCSKTSTPSMTATVEGNSVTFSSVSRSASGGVTTIQGTTNRFTLTIVLSNFAAGTYKLAAQSTNNYASLIDGAGESYITDANNTGQIVITQSGSTYSATFSFYADEVSPVPAGNNTDVTGGTCANL